MMKPGGKLTEIVGAGIWLLAAGNIMVYTVQCFKATYESPPLTVWQGTAGGAGKKTTTKPGTKPNAKPKAKRSLLEKLINPLGDPFEKAGEEIGKELGL
jgi:hypothetical protein